jgi:hypothetical protein
VSQNFIFVIASKRSDEAIHLIQSVGWIRLLAMTDNKTLDNSVNLFIFAENT